MVKLLGCLCIFGGGGVVWQHLLAQRRRKRETLAELLRVLRRMGEEIRMARTPLPQLLEARAADCRSADAAELLRETAKAARQGEGLETVWRQRVEALDLGPWEKEPLLALDWTGDEEKLCNGILLVSKEMASKLEELDRQRPEETKRTTALCFSAAALLVILLI